MTVRPTICFVGINNLPALAPEFRERGMGGAELQQTLLAKALVRRDFTVSMVVADLGQPDGTVWSGIRTYKAYAPDGGVPVVRFLYPRWTGVWSALQRSDARIRYCSTAGLLPGQLALYAKSHPGKTVFRIAHDSDCRPDQLLVPNWRARRLYLYGISRVDLILAQSEAQQVEMKRNFQRDSMVIPSLMELSDENLAYAQRDVDLLWVSNIRDFKRPDLALELAASMPDLHLHLIGGTQPGQEAYFEEIKARAQSLPNVTFHGPLPYSEVNRWIARARLLLNTSRSEGFPNTFMQAWARGTPVITTFDPDGVVARERVGRTVRTLDELRGAVRELLAQAPLWSDASERSIRYANERHGERAADRYADALRQLDAAA